MARSARARLALAALCLLFVAVVLRTAWVSDDGFITYRTIDNLLDGYGPRWNPAERVQSYTHPLWLLVLTPVVAATGNAYVAALGLSFALAAVLLALLVWPVREHPWAAGFGLVAVIGSKAVVDFTTSGLENPLAHVLLAALVVLTRTPLDTAGRAATVGLVVSLIGLTRMDLLVLALPIALGALRRVRSTLPAWILGFAPLLAAWEIFSVVYYGAPFPNTAYAKIGSGVPHHLLVPQGLRYLAESFERDPLTLSAVAAACVFPAAARPGRGLPIALGLLLQLGYVVRVGGDFMSGRFLSAPFIVAVFALQEVRFARLGRARALPALAAVAVAFAGAEPPVSLLVGPSRSTRDAWGRHGIVDERAFYVERTGFLTPGGYRTTVDPAYLEWILGDLRGQHPRTIVYQTPGMAGYYLGRERHIIDTLALNDPLLARLPALPPWRVGHYQRDLPAGYFDSVDTDTNLIVDPEIAALYDRIRLATRGPLWTRERWQAIIELNLGPSSP